MKDPLVGAQDWPTVLSKPLARLSLCNCMLHLLTGLLVLPILFFIFVASLCLPGSFNFIFPRLLRQWNMSSTVNQNFASNNAFCFAPIHMALCSWLEEKHQLSILVSGTQPRFDHKKRDIWDFVDGSGGHYPPSAEELWVSEWQSFSVFYLILNATE